MKKNLLVLLITFNICDATLLTISQPGVYQLGANLIVTPTASNDQIIKISASGVTFDFNGHFISQSNAVSGIDGVFIDPNLFDVTIQNGVIQGVTGNGLSISATTTHITVSNMIFETCGTTAITATASRNIAVQDISCIGCCSNSTSTNVILFTNLQNSSLKNCTVNNTVNLSSGVFSAINLQGCNSCNLESVNILNCSAAGTTFNGLNDQSGFNCRFSDVNVKFNQAGAIFNGLSVTSTNELYSGCSCVGNSAGTSALFNGFLIQSSASLCFFERCIANNNINRSTLGAGFSVRGFSCMLVDCFSNYTNNPANNTQSLGYLLIGTANTFLNCIGSRQNDNSTQGVVVNTTQRHAIIGGYFIRNAESTSLQSFGVQAVGTASNLYVRVIAFNNGTVQANQLFNVPAGSVNTLASPQTNNINNATNSWSSVPVAL